MMGGSKIHGHMTVKLYSFHDTGGGSTYPTLPYTWQYFILIQITFLDYSIKESTCKSLVSVLGMGYTGRAVQYVCFS